MLAAIGTMNGWTTQMSNDFVVPLKCLDNDADSHYVVLVSFNEWSCLQQMDGCETFSFAITRGLYWDRVSTLREKIHVKLPDLLEFVLRRDGADPPARENGPYCRALLFFCMYLSRRRHFGMILGERPRRRHLLAYINIRKCLNGKKRG